MAAQRASVSGSLVGRFAFIGKSVRGRLTVSFHSGMGIRRFYNELMATRRSSAEPRSSATLDNGLKVLIQEEHTAPLASVWCWYKVGSKDERPGLTGVSHWCRAHELQGHDQHPARSGEGHHRAVRRQLERLHLDRSDDVSRDGDARRARSHAVHRVRADGAAASIIPTTASRSARSSSRSCRAARTIPISCSIRS